ncbi:putative nicotinamide mononucleotide transporter [Mycolicibacterium aichiense]|uniref:Nicotinamide mononucleotide transporter n=2 Tax=Mycolicibacterium aichiense TaxID=1799 RepID=A0AAD1HSI5_9MYCO|nr:nicotinamide mononucleotide transporter [Mycolicibacterium aichiense]BBX09938.1 putative nicotinamide mononucleotide transporter [Mycolicibacterium aichiense]STZ26397.1 nicotinamide mononucleotide transporter pnuC [Mycolicibacterium aichiense]
MIEWLAALVAPLNTVTFTLWGDPVSWAELLGFVTGGACVALTVRRSVANFPVGIANSAFFLVLFASAQLWADSGLQAIYIILGFIGWWQWLYGNTDRTPLPVRGVSRRHFIWCVVAVAVGTAALYPLLMSMHDSAPFLDALTTSLSLVAQWLLNGKWIESWYFWVAADCIYVPLYFSRGLNLTAVVYMLFLALCVTGWRAWRRELALERETVGSAG